MTEQPWIPCRPPPKPPAAREHCRHYSYQGSLVDGGPRCAAGVDNSAPGATLPCMPEPKATCPAREEWTAEERARWERWEAEHTQRMRVIMTAIPRDGFAGNLRCPGCGFGVVRWGRARSNNHLHAACSTPHCFSVMQ